MPHGRHLRFLCTDVCRRSGKSECGRRWGRDLPIAVLISTVGVASALRLRAASLLVSQATEPPHRASLFEGSGSTANHAFSLSKSTVARVRNLETPTHTPKSLPILASWLDCEWKRPAGGFNFAVFGAIDSTTSRLSILQCESNKRFQFLSASSCLCQMLNDAATTHPTEPLTRLLALAWYEKFRR